jgi:hypothetical protein
MNRTFHFGIILAVSVHMLCGCCLHHAHGSQPVNSEQVVNSCACENHGHERSSNPCDHRSGNHGCGGDQCVFTISELDSASQAATDLNCLPFIGVVSILPEMDRSDAVDAIPHYCGPPIPLHLLNQVLLI